ncbi:competence protein CoiA [Jeotgalibacillus sp. R-1-5s-1]|uniref:competence protein CoiA n=1 Tax=Jeotgalibacillus sp. R-1-5s-1 TaxID=2555897 RepID=UPI00106A7457|nr:competence protein CoiA family protein [Jeotgalibacillus sp. R-1-5s-1]TFD97599.1 hypothetical protein E2491_09225 [Jeotgalibacillus sp. R-1-5s-1]
MLTALNEKNELVSLIQFSSREQLHCIHATSSFICSSCRSPVILKVGKIKTPHFAHRSRKNCPSSSEGETDNHLKGKKSLYLWLQSIGLNPEVEQVYQQIGRRADIAVHTGDQEYAIEFQCSPISSKVMLERSKDYYSLNIIPVWILSYEALQLSASGIIKFTEFHQQFLRYSETLKQYFLLSYSSEKNIFIIIYLISPISKHSFIVTVEHVLHQSFPFPKFPLTAISLNTDHVGSYILYREKWIVSRFKYNQGHKDHFLRKLYEEQETILLNPPWNGLPLCSNTYFVTHSCEWQTYLYLHMKKEKALTKERLLAHFIQLIKQKIIETRQLQINGSIDYAVKSVSEWLKMMELCHVVTKQGKMYFINDNCMKHKVETVEKRDEAVKNFMNKYMNDIINLYNAR